MTLSMAPARLWIYASSDPTVNDDGANGFEIGNWWLNQSTTDLFQAKDVSTGAAVWEIYYSDTDGATFASVRIGAGGPQFLAGSGSPDGSVTAPKGSYYSRTDGSSTSTRAYINTDGSTAWTSITTAS